MSERDQNLTNFEIKERFGKLEDEILNLQATFREAKNNVIDSGAIGYTPQEMTTIKAQSSPSKS